MKCTVERSKVYWNDVIVPSLQAGKTVLIVGHENNLRSLIMKLENISKDDIINLNLPRAVPLAYRIDPVTLQPQDRPDGRLDEATGLLRGGEWIGGDKAVQQILDRDDKQVYDTTIQENLEIGTSRDNWNTWMEFVIGKPSLEQSVKGCGTNERTDPKNTIPTTTESMTSASTNYDNNASATAVNTTVLSSSSKSSVRKEKKIKTPETKYLNGFMDSSSSNLTTTTGSMKTITTTN